MAKRAMGTMIREAEPAGGEDDELIAAGEHEVSGQGADEQREWRGVIKDLRGQEKEVAGDKGDSGLASGDRGDQVEKGKDEGCHDQDRGTQNENPEDFTDQQVVDQIRDARRERGTLCWVVRECDGSWSGDGFPKPQLRQSQVKLEVSAQNGEGDTDHVGEPDSDPGSQYPGLSQVLAGSEQQVICNGNRETKCNPNCFAPRFLRPESDNDSNQDKDNAGDRDGAAFMPFDAGDSLLIAGGRRNEPGKLLAAHCLNPIDQAQSLKSSHIPLRRQSEKALLKSRHRVLIGILGHEQGNAVRELYLECDLRRLDDSQLAPARGQNE